MRCTATSMCYRNGSAEYYATKIIATANFEEYRLGRSVTGPDRSQADHGIARTARSTLGAAHLVGTAGSPTQFARVARGGRDIADGAAVARKRAARSRNCDPFGRGRLCTDAARTRDAGGLRAAISIRRQVGFRADQPYEVGRVMIVSFSPGCVQRPTSKEVPKASRSAAPAKLGCIVGFECDTRIVSYAALLSPCARAMSAFRLRPAIRRQIPAANALATITSRENRIAFWPRRGASPSLSAPMIAGPEACPNSAEQSTSAETATARIRTRDTLITIANSGPWCSSTRKVVAALAATHNAVSFFFLSLLLFCC